MYVDAGTSKLRPPHKLSCFSTYVLSKNFFGFLQVFSIWGYNISSVDTGVSNDLSCNLYLSLTRVESSKMEDCKHVLAYLPFNYLFPYKVLRCFIHSMLMEIKIALNTSSMTKYYGSTLS